MSDDEFLSETKTARDGARLSCMGSRNKKAKMTKRREEKERKGIDLALLGCKSHLTYIVNAVRYDDGKSAGRDLKMEKDVTK